ncbi:DUF6449 domain-containing protein [Alkaliphilus peptidifermentans]|uniref:ABC-2 type transport system permease protein n=1 Tax=Alkaliphilus peptidifermentans DSM 18978 TaxID=1120976 RepID=A0A1G5GHM1_9FIRM|nr:DUF6449 domain-containing protein [Alkaliphilus peptidifermentans]SCY50847.1 ABC-2 type transport system permease protein [Alkaliphilus peptidifermentans DSM 18978]
MSLKTSYFNTGIIKNSLKRFYWMGILYFVALFFMVPIRILMTLSSLDNYSSRYVLEGIFTFRHESLQQLLIITIPVLFAALLFNYMQSKNPSDMIHSLPIKRNKLFNSKVAIGMLFLTLPVIFVAITGFIIKIIFNLEVFYTTMDILIWTGSTILLNVVIFLTTVFVGVVTGISVVQGILSYIILLLPAGLWVLVYYSLDSLLYGFATNYYKDNLFFDLSPIIRVLELHSSLQWKEVLAYILYCIFIYFVGIFLYNKRKLELNLQSIVFTKLHYLFKYGVAFCSMLLGGVYIYSIRAGFAWVLFGYAAFSFIGYCIAEGVLLKSVRIFTKKMLRDYLLYLIVITILLTGITFDITGYQRRVPELAEIEGVYFNSIYYYRELNDDNIYSSQENIIKFQQLHRGILENKSLGKKLPVIYGDSVKDVTLIYQLVDGGKVARKYTIDYKDYKELLKPIYESLEYKNINYPIIQLSPAATKKIVIRSNEISKSVSIVDSDEIQQVMEIIKKEVTSASYENLNDSRTPWGQIYFEIDEDFVEENDWLMTGNIDISWLKSFNILEEWMQQHNYLEKAIVTPEDIQYVVIEKVTSPDDSHYIYNKEAQGRSRLEILDKTQIEGILENYSEQWIRDNYPRYMLAFYGYEDYALFYGSIEEKYVPQFVKDILQ